MENSKDIAFFKSPLVPHTALDGKTSAQKLHSIENNPKFVLRELGPFLVDGEPFFSNEPSSIEQASAEVSRAFTELSEKFGIPAPVSFIVGLNEKGEKVIYAVVDSIVAEYDIENLSALTDEQKNTLGPQMYALWEKLIAYYETKLQDGTLFLNDICATRQYVYGRKEGDTKSTLYLVDVDPYFGDSHSEAPPNLTTARNDLDDLEIEFEDVIDFAPLISRFENMLEQFPQHDEQ